MKQRRRAGVVPRVVSTNASTLVAWTSERNGRSVIQVSRVAD